MNFSAPNINTLVRYNVISVFVLSMIAVSTSFIFTLSEKGSVPHSSDVNVVTIGSETYDAVVCPTGSTDASCTNFGASGMQTVINNAPSRSKDNPYKVFIKNGEYTGFVPLALTETRESGILATFYTFFNIKNKSILIKGESNVLTIINGQDQNSAIFNVDDSDYVEFNNFRVVNTKNIRYTDTTLDSTTGCKKTNSSICFSYTGTFIRSTSSTKKAVSQVVLNSIYAYKTVDLLYIFTYVQNSKFDIKNSVAHSMRETGITAYGSNTINVLASEFIAISDNYANYATMFFGDNIVLNFTNSIVFWINNPNSSCLKLTDNAIANITNSLFSNCMLNVITLLDNSKIYINNSILQSANYYGVRANDTSSAEVKNSFIFQAGQGPTRGNVTLINPPLNSNYTDDPQIVFSVSDYYNPNSFSPLATSRSRNSGDPLILNADGSRSHIGPAGGPNACLFKSYFPGCNGNPTPVVTPTISPSPTTIPSPSINPTVKAEADLNKDNKIDLLDVFVLLGIILN